MSERSILSAMGKRGFGSIYQQKKRAADGSTVALPTWWLKYSKNGQVFRESSGSHDRREAERLLKRRLGETVTGRFAGLGPERIRFSELAQAVIEDYEVNGRRSAAHVERRLRLHLLPALGDLRAAELGTAHLKRYVGNRRAEGASNASINRELAILKRAFRLAAQSDPPRVAREPHVPMLKESNARTGFLEPEAYRTLRDTLPQDLKPLLVVGYYLGCRRAELCALKWSQVDLGAGLIRLEGFQTKNGEARTLPIYGELVEWLTMQRETRDALFPQCEHVFHRHGRPIKNFRKAWAAACEDAGLGGLLFHDLRRSAIRNMVRAGISEKIAMAVSGHKTRSVFDRYNIVSMADLKEAGRKMEQWGSGILSGIPAEKQESSGAKKSAGSALQ